MVDLLDKIDGFLCYESIEDDFITPIEVLKRIEILVKRLLGSIHISLALINLSKSNISYDQHFRIRVGQKQKLRTWEKDPASYCRMWILLGKIYSLVVGQNKITLRGCYYGLVGCFRDQRQFNAVVNDVTALLRVSRQYLGIIAECQGKIGGLVEYHSPNGNVIQLKHLNGMRISGTDPKRWIWSSINKPMAILVIEKDAIFQKLIEERIYDRLPLALLTGCGYPDLTTRMALNHLSRDWNIPIVGLFDFNPDGFQIFLSYRCGSVTFGNENDRITVPIRFMGIEASDVHEKWRFKPLTVRERGLLASLKSSLIVQSHPKLQRYLESMEEQGTAEIEAIQENCEPIVELDLCSIRSFVPRCHPLIDIISKKLLKRQYIF